MQLVGSYTRPTHNLDDLSTIFRTARVRTSQYFISYPVLLCHVWITDTIAFDGSVSHLYTLHIVCSVLMQTMRVLIPMSDAHDR